MALFDFLKKKKEVKAEKPKEKKAEKPKKEEVVVKKEIKEKAVRPKRERKITGDALKVLRFPYVAEKSTDLLEKNQYVFRVLPRANKTETKKAIESIFKVDVLGVRIINLPRKRRRVGKTEGFRNGYKKAIVRIRQGQKIEILTR